MSNSPQWATRSGDVWAERWRDTDQALAGLSPALHAAILAAAPDGPLRAFDIGCGPGSTSLDLAAARPDARIVACDLSPALVELARERLASFAGAQVVLGDAQAAAVANGPFDLLYSRHGVMFFANPVAAFSDLRRAVRPGGRLLFSCFQSWGLNPWACELASAAAGRPLAPPGSEPGAFAFAEPPYVRGILDVSGWANARAQAIAFTYVAGEGPEGVADALSFLCAIGPAARAIEELPADAREDAILRVRRVIEAHSDGEQVQFAAAAWIWSAEAPLRSDDARA